VRHVSTKLFTSGKIHALVRMFVDALLTDQDALVVSKHHYLPILPTVVIDVSPANTDTVLVLTELVMGIILTKVKRRVRL
jgi:hypothetical protein